MPLYCNCPGIEAGSGWASAHPLWTKMIGISASWQMYGAFEIRKITVYQFGGRIMKIISLKKIRCANLLKSLKAATGSLEFPFQETRGQIKKGL